MGISAHAASDRKRCGEVLGIAGSTVDQLGEACSPNLIFRPDVRILKATIPDIMRQVIFFFSTLLCITLVNAQDEPVYIQVDYMKPLDGKAEEYVWMENTVYKPIHQERINNGEIVAWHLYEVQYPRGADMEYDYVTITIFANFGSIDEGNTPFDELVAEVHPDKTVDEVAGIAEETRKLVRSEAFKSVHRYPGTSYDPARTLLVDYMKVSPVNQHEYVRMENQIWCPLHQERIKRGIISGWELFELLFPGGLNYPYTYATTTGFEHWDQMKDAWPDDIWSSVHSGASQTELEQRAHETRDLVSTQIWKLVDYTVAPSE